MNINQNYIWQQLQRRRTIAAAVMSCKRYSFAKQRPYLFEYQSNGMYDIHQHDDVLLNNIWPMGMCSSFRVGQFHCRNYDWNFDRSPTIVVFTPCTRQHKHATLGVSQLMSLEAENVVNGYRPEYLSLEPLLCDGMNDAGLVCNINVVPAGDSPWYPDGVFPETTPVWDAYNITYGTCHGKPLMFVSLMLRLFLDNCSTVDEAIDESQKWSFYAARNTKNAFIEEFHIMVSDRNGDTAVFEFVSNEIVVHKWIDGQYVGVVYGNNDLAICNNVLPVMTNFYLSKWDGYYDDFSMQLPANERNKTVTLHSQGLERYAAICSQIENGISSNAQAKAVLESVKYRQMYSTKLNEWNTEFLGGDFSFRGIDLDNPDLVGFKSRASEFAAKEDELDAQGNRTRNKDAKTWHTVHSSIYDVENMTLELYVQEDFSNEHKFVYTF